MAGTEKTSFMSHTTYDRLKFIAQILLPALGTLVFAVGGIWNLDYITQIVGTITAIDAFLGLILQLASNSYYKSGSNFDGELRMDRNEDGTEKVVFAVNSDPETVVRDFGKHSFEFFVNRGDQPSK